MNNKPTSQVIKKTKAFFFIYCSLIVLMVLARSSPLLLKYGISYVSNWRYTHYLFNYKDEFVKRGLIGELISLLYNNISYDLVSIFSYIVLGILFYLFFIFFSKLYLVYDKNPGAFSLIVIAFCSPATLQHFALDVGRFDLIIYSIFILIILAINSFSNKNKLIIFIIINLSLSLSILVHEAAFFMILPLSIVFWNYANHSKKNLILQIISFLFILILTFFASTYGKYTSLDFESHLKNLEKIYGNRVIGDSLSVIHHASIKENLTKTIKVGINFKRLLDHLFFTFFMLPFFYLIYNLYLSVKNQLNFRIKVVFLTSLSPLALYPLGHDHFRWLSLAITNFIISIFFIIYRDDALRKQALSFFEEREKLVAFVVFFSFISGPLGVIESFDIINHIVRVVKYFN